jgi:hypothetical protein
MRLTAAILVAAACLGATPACAQDRYAAVLLQYLTGDADAAIAALLALDATEIDAGVAAFDTTRSRQILTGAAAMHTEAAIRGGAHLASYPHSYHLQIATAIVEYGERHTTKSNTSKVIHPQFAVPVSDDFRRLWYCTVITGLETGANLPPAERYLAHAVALYQGSPEILLLAGITEEMRASSRISGASAGEQRKALEQAEKYYRGATAAAPDRLEARLRLGRVLNERDKDAEARTLLAPLTTVSDDRIAYLASLFLGGIEDHDHHADAALALYERAATEFPHAQTAQLAASELRHRRGDHQAAAEAVPMAAGADNAFDPWWTYVFGEYWRVDLLLNAVRGKRRV